MSVYHIHVEYVHVYLLYCLLLYLSQELQLVLSLSDVSLHNLTEKHARQSLHTRLVHLQTFLVRRQRLARLPTQILLIGQLHTHTCTHKQIYTFIQTHVHIQTNSRMVKISVISSLSTSQSVIYVKLVIQKVSGKQASKRLSV